MDLTELTATYPFIPWTEPIRITRTDGAASGYACRVCIAQGGVHGSELPQLLTDPDTVRGHIKEAHGQ